MTLCRNLDTIFVPALFWDDRLDNIHNKRAVGHAERRLPMVAAFPLLLEVFRRLPGEGVANHAALAVAGGDDYVSLRRLAGGHNREGSVVGHILFRTFGFYFQKFLFCVPVAAAGVDGFYQNFIFIHCVSSFLRNGSGLLRSHFDGITCS